MAAIPVTVEGTARGAPATAFAVIPPIDLPSVFTGYGPLPAVEGTRDQTGPWNVAGSSRTVLLSDGTEVAETLTAVEPPSRFAYRVGPFPGPLGRLVHHADGEWLFAPAGDGRTRVTWTYAFEAAGPFGPLVRLLVAPLWRRYAERVLRGCIAAVER